MPQNGYWIECVPVSRGQNNGVEEINEEECLYEAMICSIPEAKATARTPDSAIQELRNKLKSLRHEYCMQGKALPEHDSPIQPPRCTASHQGWIYVYVKMTECCQSVQ